MPALLSLPTSAAEPGAGGARPLCARCRFVRGAPPGQAPPVSSGNRAEAGQAGETSKAPWGRLRPSTDLSSRPKRARDGAGRGGGGPGLSVGQRHFGQKDKAAGRAVPGTRETGGRAACPPAPCSDGGRVSVCVREPHTYPHPACGRPGRGTGPTHPPRPRRPPPAELSGSGRPVPADGACPLPPAAPDSARRSSPSPGRAWGRCRRRAGPPGLMRRSPAPASPLTVAAGAGPGSGKGRCGPALPAGPRSAGGGPWAGGWPPLILQACTGSGQEPRPLRGETQPLGSSSGALRPAFCFSYLRFRASAELRACAWKESEKWRECNSSAKAFPWIVVPKMLTGLTSPDTNRSRNTGSREQLATLS